MRPNSRRSNATPGQRRQPRRSLFIRFGPARHSSRLPLHSRSPYFEEMLAFEHALVSATVHGTSSEIAWSADPTMLLDALDAGTLPGQLPAVSSTMRIRAA